MLLLLLSCLSWVESRAAVDFETQVMPVLMRAGCNSGACHGAAAGRGGLRLSLWGSNPGDDYDALVNELEGRRINLVHPNKSLILRKPTGDLNHGGGRRFDADSESTALLEQWIENGAPRGPSRKLVRVEVSPATHRAKAVDEAVILKVWAHYDKGDKVDVTRWAVFTSPDTAAVEIDGNGKARLHRRGQHTVLVRFLDRIVPVPLTLPLNEKPVDLSRSPRHNYIDEQINATLETLHLSPGPMVDDATFLRRVSLDLTGTVPTPKKVHAFLDDTNKDKRARLIDELLASEDFVDFWTLKWSQWLNVTSARLGAGPAKTMQVWLRQQVDRNAPLDQLAGELLTTLGDTNRVGAAGFVRLSESPGALAENVSRLFLGARLQCANCHNHPLDRWTQDDYHGLAAIFAKLERLQIVKVIDRGEVIHPRTGEAAIPRLPGTRFLDEKSDQRETLAKWLVSKDNPAFARALANRLWREMMGRGLVEPVDDMRATNPATHPELLDKLAADLVEANYDMRAVLKRIATSAAYQRSSRSDGTFKDDRFYSRAIVKLLSPEVHADALTAVTGIADKYFERSLGARAITLHDAGYAPPSLEILGRCGRPNQCDDPSQGGGLSRMLHVINGSLLNDRITAKDGQLRQLLDRKSSDADIVRDIYLRAYGRIPSKEESAFWAEQCRTAKTDSERRHLLEDFLWAVLTSKEFTTNH